MPFGNNNELWESRLVPYFLTPPPIAYHRPAEVDEGVAYTQLIADDTTLDDFFPGAEPSHAESLLLRELKTLQRHFMAVKCFLDGHAAQKWQCSTTSSE